MYMKSNPKSSKEHYNNEITTKRVTPEPRHAMYSEEAESISKVLENLVSNKGIYIDKLSERQVPRETQRFFNYQLNSESYIDDRSKFIIENGKPNQENIKSVFQEPINFGTPHDLSFKALLKNIYKLFAKPQTSNENKVTRIEIDTPENKPSKHDNVNEQRPQSAAEYVKYNADENVFTNNPLNKKLNLLKSLLTNFQINKFKDNGDITATITRLEQLGNNEVCSPLTTLALKDNLSRNHNVPPSPLAGPMNDIMNRAITTHSMENINYFEKNTEKSQKLLQQYNPPLEKSMNYFEQTTEHSEKFIQEYKAPPGPRIIYLKLTTEKPQKLIQQFEAQPVKIENYSEQNTEQYQKFTQHYNAPPVETINYFEPYMEQPQKFIQHYSLPRNPDTPGIQTFVHDLANSSHENTQSSTPQRLPLKEIIFTTPSISTAINNEKFLHPDVMKEIAENVKKLVLNDIQDRILAITKPTITTEITTKLQPKNTTTTTLQNSPKDKTQNISTTADMFAASLTKIDSEKLKQATIIIEKFIELFKHIKLMQEIKSMAVTATPNTSKNITYKELVQPQINFPVLVDSSGYIPPTSVNMKLQDKSSLHDLLPQEFQAKPGSYDLPQELSPFDLMLQAHKRALDIQLQSIKPQQLLDINVQASKLPISFESRLHPPFPFNMKIQPSKILPIIINPYTQTLQSLPYHNLNVNQAHINNGIPNINKLNNSVTVQQTDVGAIAPIQMVNPVGLNNHIVLSSPLPLGLTQDEKNRWNIMIKYGKSQAEIKDVESRKHTLSTYSNTPYHIENSSHELGSTLQNRSINHNVPIFNQDRKQYVNDFRIGFNPERTSAASKQDAVPQLKTDVNISNYEQPRTENPKNSDLENILAEVEKIAKVFGYKSGVQDKSKCSNGAHNNEQNQNREKIAEVLEYQNVIDDKTKSLNIAEDVDIQNQNNSNNVIFKNAGNTYEEKLNSKENTNIGIGYNSKRNPFDHRSKLDPRIIHLNQMARFLRANDKEEVFSNVFKRVYTPQTLQNIYTKRNSPDNNFAIQGTPNYGDSVMVAMDSFKNKEYREKGISFDRRYNSGGANSEKIPVGYHEKLERFEERSQYKDKDWQNTPQARPSAPISNIKPPSIYNDAPFKNFLKTQQKVNKILERLLATRTDDAARSTETI
ncbi:uncharacterized protein LOC113240307 isoform X2 [Hyposmocoma kahamanoa]|uniref:uncharacterized protein LOC113240307 isoform X2 n=1 Tax=Hyposmocoma kahamanoa TaxID=1477025 RepID=UPI000E6D5CC4|nr:uncharacterized protein LOC113240307 isoform X2 [Hyposmocoma kahamanoa]